MPQPDFFVEGTTPRIKDTRHRTWTKILGSYQNLGGALPGNNPRAKDSMRRLKRKLVSALQGVSSDGSSGAAVITSATDNFNRANGGLGADWTNPAATSDGAVQLVIASNQVTTTVQNLHAYATWLKNQFGNDQYSQVKIVNIGQWSGVIVRQSAGVDKAYIGFVFAANDFRFYHRWLGVYTQLKGLVDRTWSAADVFKLESYGLGPVFLYIYQNGVVVADCSHAGAQVITGGNPGIGIFSPVGTDLIVDDWAGGTILTSLPDITSDTFVRADGAPGLGWASTPDNSGLKIVSNKVKARKTSDNGMMFSTHVFGANHKSTATLSTQIAGDWTAVSVRSNFVKWYSLLILGGFPTTSASLYAFDGATYQLLNSNATVTWNAGDTFSVSAEGAGPVTLRVWKNGVEQYNFVDSTYNLTGTYAGLGMWQAGGGTSGLGAWVGATI